MPNPTGKNQYSKGGGGGSKKGKGGSAAPALSAAQKSRLQSISAKQIRAKSMGSGAPLSKQAANNLARIKAKGL